MTRNTKLTKNQKSKLQVAGIKYSRRARNGIEMKKIKKIQIKEDLEIELVTDFIEQRQMR